MFEFAHRWFTRGSERVKSMGDPSWPRFRQSHILDDRIRKEFGVWRPKGRELFMAWQPDVAGIFGDTMWSFPTLGIRQSSSSLIGYSIINHPAIKGYPNFRTPPCGKTMGKPYSTPPFKYFSISLGTPTASPRCMCTKFACNFRKCICPWTAQS